VLVISPLVSAGDPWKAPTVNAVPSATVEAWLSTQSSRELYPERDEDDPSFAQPQRPAPGPRAEARWAHITRVAMLAVGLGF
jgi:hypothetical protein